MTGEITLKGLVLPIGTEGKLLAAKQAGIRKVILPKRNQKDMTEVPKEARSGLTIIYIQNVRQILNYVFENKAGK